MFSSSSLNSSSSSSSNSSGDQTSINIQTSSGSYPSSSSSSVGNQTNRCSIIFDQDIQLLNPADEKRISEIYCSKFSTFKNDSNKKFHWGLKDNEELFIVINEGNAAYQDGVFWINNNYEQLNLKKPSFSLLID
ncbi:MAG: hypothetical protein KIT27_11740, partial [Legionellales bacterium]|nr:hypothetical protein [Legionellales bacterium]